MIGATRTIKKNRGSLTSRIALTVFLSIAVPPLINIIFFLAVPFQEIRIFSARWLIGRVIETVQLAESVPADDRLATFAILPGAKYLDVSIVNEPSGPPQGMGSAFSGFAALIDANIERELKRGGQEVIVTTITPQSAFPFPFVSIHFENVPVYGEERYRELTLTRGDLPVPSVLSVYVRLKDGDWLRIAAAQPGSGWWRIGQIAFVVVTTLSLLGALVFVVARSLTKPLLALGKAVETFGDDYVAEPIPALGIAEYDRIAGKFNQLQVQMASYLRERTQMIGAISHDLRTPLTRLRLFVEYLDDEDIKKNAIRSIDDMHSMIEDTLSYADGLWNQEKRTTTDIAVMLITEADAQTDLGWTVEYNGPAHAPLLCYPTALRRAFANLIENGIKYGTAVGITLSSGDREIVISITDQGPGFSAEQEAAALSPFGRLEASRNRETGGTGLGLTIARDVISRHGGSLNFRQLRDDGFEARVVLPSASATV